MDLTKKTGKKTEQNKNEQKKKKKKTKTTTMKYEDDSVRTNTNFTWNNLKEIWPPPKKKTVKTLVSEMY